MLGTPEYLIRTHSNFIPKHRRKRTLDAVLNSKLNLSKNEQYALKVLKKTGVLLLKRQITKGGGRGILMEKDFYEDQISTMLQDRHRLAKHKKIKPCQN